ncbi:MAG: MFS transporter [Deltaproteobacteria bacterium]|nr:MFS transporter [Deltaproteobacteria bacterium]
MSIGKYKDLLKSLGFQSYIWTQFLGAFNDNVFKIVLSMVAVNMTTHGSGGYVSLVGAVFILPFFFFSGYAGYVADAYNKRTVLIYAKFFEIIAVTFGFYGFVSGKIEIMLCTLFLMALHSTFFGPAKYGIVPEMLPDRDLSRANGILEMSTFLAIILGTSIGTIIFSVWKDKLSYVGIFLIAIAIAGTLTSFGITRVKDSGAQKKFNLNPWSEIGWGIRRLYGDRLLSLTVIGITYFWFLGALLQMDILLLGKEVMHLNDMWIGILITFLAVGIGIGSIVAGYLSGDKVELGLVPVGSLGMGGFAILLAYSVDSYAKTAAALIMLGFTGGLAIVPLNALLQQKSGATEKGRLIATNNFISTAGILSASGILWLFKDKMDIGSDKIILIFGVATLLATIFMMKHLPDFLVRFAFWMLTHTLYKIKVVGEDNVPFRGPALLVSNHLSFADGFLVGACVQRFIRFVIYKYFYDLRGIHWFLKIMKVIPISEGNRRDALKSIQSAREELKAGHVVCIFAEGAISRTGNLQPFKKGLERMVEGLDIPIIPVHLDRVWGSIFSFKGGLFFWKWPKEFPYHVTVSFGKPLKSGSSALEVRQAVMELGSEAVEHRRTARDLLHFRFIKMAKSRWFSFCMADSTGKRFTWGKTLVSSILLSKWIAKRNADEKMIGILLPASAGAAIANIAAEVAGKVPVNLNFLSGGDSMASCIAQSGIKTIITSRAFLSRAGLEDADGMVFLEDIISTFSASEKAVTALAAFLLPHRALESIYCKGEVDPNKLATVIFTSGSTGHPKGVMLTHHNILSNLEGFSQVFLLSHKDVLVGVLPFFHSFGYTGTIWFPLITGIGVVYHSNPMDARTVGELTARYKGTIMIGTPAFYSSYIRKCAAGEFSTLRYAIAGAEKLREHIAWAFKEKFGLELLEGYGCTELSPVVSVNVPDVEYDDIKQTGFIPGTVGHAIPGVAVKVVNPEDWTELPAGKEGLLLIKGPNLMKGYLGDSERTKEAIHDGWYVTGDIASIGDNGFIKITDRLSRFSKIGGEMIPHIKVEETISKVLGGCHCAVTALPDEQKGERIIAFYTKNAPPMEVWKRLLEAGLPKLWLPKREDLYHIDELPSTASGKVDIKKIKLLAMELAGA